MPAKGDFVSATMPSTPAGETTGGELAVPVFVSLIIGVLRGGRAVELAAALVCPFSMLIMRYENAASEKLVMSTTANRITELVFILFTGFKFFNIPFRFSFPGCPYSYP